MPDPLSITGLILELGSVMKVLYDYGKRVKNAQKIILSLCSELAALKSILADLQAQQDGGTVHVAEQEFAEMLDMTESLLSGIASKIDSKSHGVKRAMQSFKFPLDEDSIKETIQKLERLKSWFILVLMSEQHNASNSLNSNLVELTNIIQKDISRRRQHEDEQALQKIRATLGPVTPDVTHRKACAVWQDTGPSSWFLDGPVATWMGDASDTERVLVLTGKSGAGKTTLISQAVEHCKQHASGRSDLQVAYFYCSYNDSSSQEVRNILGSWLAQISVTQTEAARHIDLSLRDNDPVLIESMERALTKVNGTVLLILDALNESYNAEKLLRCISRLTSGGADIKCLLSTTFILEHSSLKYSKIEMNKNLVTPDIVAYIRSRHAHHRILQNIPESEILEILLPRSGGMFRWVDCQMNILCEQLTPKLVRKALHSLPGNLNDTYAVILSRVAENDRAFVREALLWLSFSHRPLKLHELCEAVVVEEGDTTIDDSCRLDPYHRLVELCRGLVVWDKLTNGVSLAHSSVRTFLTGEEIRSASCSIFALDEQDCNREIFRKCITYMMMTDFNLPYCPLKTIRQLRKEFPLLEYASLKWALHAQQVQYKFDQHDLQLIDAFFLTQKAKTGGSNFSFWINCIIPETNKRIIAASEPLYYAASFGLEVCVERLFRENLISRSNPDDPWYIDHKCGRNSSTALQVTCVRGTRRTAEVLLQNGADPNSTGASRNTCLWFAARQGRPDVIELLMAHGAVMTEREAASLSNPKLDLKRLTAAIPSLGTQKSRWADFFRPDTIETKASMERSE